MPDFSDSIYTISPELLRNMPWYLSSSLSMGILHFYHILQVPTPAPSPPCKYTHPVDLRFLQNRLMFRPIEVGQSISKPLPI